LESLGEKIKISPKIQKFRKTFQILWKIETFIEKLSKELKILWKIEKLIKELKML